MFHYVFQLAALPVCWSTYWKLHLISINKTCLGKEALELKSKKNIFGYSLANTNSFLWSASDIFFTSVFCTTALISFLVTDRTFNFTSPAPLFFHWGEGLREQRERNLHLHTKEWKSPYWTHSEASGIMTHLANKNRSLEFIWNSSMSVTTAVLSLIKL